MPADELKKVAPVTVWGTFLMVAIVINVVQFRDIQTQGPVNFRPFATWRTNDLFSLAKRLGVVRERYSAAIALADVAPNSTVILPQQSDFPDREFKAQMHTWGKVKSFTYRKYNPDKLLPHLDLGVSVLKSLPKQQKYDRRKFVVLGRPTKGKRKAREFIVLRRGEIDVLVDTALVKSQLKGLDLGS